MLTKEQVEKAEAAGWVFSYVLRRSNNKLGEKCDPMTCEMYSECLRELHDGTHLAQHICGAANTTGLWYWK